MHSLITHCGKVCRAISHCRFSVLTSLAPYRVYHGSALNRVLLSSARRQQIHGSSVWCKTVISNKNKPTLSCDDTGELRDQNVSLGTNDVRISLADNNPNVLETRDKNDSHHDDDLPAITTSDHELDILSAQNEPKVLTEFADTPLMPASYSLAAYVEHSEVLQKLVQLGVDLSRVERKKNVGNELLRMKFDPDITEKISFLHHVGIESENLGKYLTTNPFILLEDQANLEKRVDYLKSKKFDQAAISQIVNRAPFFLSFSVERVDRRLGFYQQSLKLTGDELRQIICACPKLVTHKITRAKDNLFLLNKQFGFYQTEVKQLVLSHPRILTRSENKLISIFDYLHNDMCIPHKLILQNYQVFNERAFKIQERHQMLQKLGRAQYDPTQSGYISLKRLVTLPDEAFCDELAMVTLAEYNSFLKTL